MGLSTPNRTSVTRAILCATTRQALAAFYRRYNACCNAHAFAQLGEFVARHVVVNGRESGLDAYADALRVVTRGFPDYRWELRHLVVDPPWIAAHLADTGTHRRPFHGVEPTGRSVGTPEFAVYRLDAGRIAEVWAWRSTCPSSSSSGERADGLLGRRDDVPSPRRARKLARWCAGGRGLLRVHALRRA